MKISMFLVLVATGLVKLCFGSNWEHWPVREQETIQKTLPLSGGPMRVVVDNVDGYVHVTGTGGSEVRVVAHKIVRSETESDLQDAKKEVTLQIDGKPGSVSVYYDAPWRCNGNNRSCEGDHRHFYNVTYDIDVEVPRGARTVLSTVNNGDIRLDKSDGDFDISNVNGGIHMNAVSGSGDVHTVNGPVVVHYSHNPTKATSFKSVNGELDLYFPSDLSADLRLKTFNGQVYSDFDVAPTAITEVESERRNGRFVYRSNGFTGGRAGNGGPELTLDTLNGSIRLHRER